MKGLYLAFGHSYAWDQINSETSNGIVKKIFNQIQLFNNVGFEIDYYNPYANRNQKIYKVERRLPFAYLHPWDIHINELKKFDFLYVRKAGFMDGDLILFFKKIKKINPKIKIVMEIPTYPYEKENRDIKYIPLMIKDKKWCIKLNEFVDRVITYSTDKQIFGIPTINISNAISYQEEKRKVILHSLYKNTIEMIACSVCSYWHGYDRALKGLVDYYKGSTPYKIVLHIVGEGQELSHYKEFVRRNNLSDKVIFHGFLKGEELDSVYNRCVIGLDSMGRHRSGVYYNSSLKGKEYVAKGLIVVSGVTCELDYDLSYKYYIRVPADDTDIDFNSIINKFEDLIKKESLDVIQKNIMSYAQDHYDYSVAMNEVVEFLKLYCNQDCGE